MTFADWIHTVCLALLQGFTEFLPISSSAHLILPSQVFGWPDQGQFFDVGVHVGTLVAVVFYFRREVCRILAGWLASFKGKKSTEGRIGWLLALATIPALLFGAFFNSMLEEYGRSILVIGTTTIVFGVLLGWADRRKGCVLTIENMNLRQALLIGVAQAVALIPGTSRSGITMTAAMMLGFERSESARFSFLMSIPVIVAAAGLKIIGCFGDNAETVAATGSSWLMVVVGAVLSALSALVCIVLFLKAINRIGMMPFVIYRLLLGVMLFGIWFVAV